MSLLFLVFGFMLIALCLGLLLGWLIWRYDNSAESELSALNSEVSFWRENLDHCRRELSDEKDAIAMLNAERAKLRNRIRALETAAEE